VVARSIESFLETRFFPYFKHQSIMVLRSERRRTKRSSFQKRISSNSGARLFSQSPSSLRFHGGTFVAETLRSLATPTTRQPRSLASTRRSSSCRTGDVVSSVRTDRRTDNSARG